MDFNFLNQKEPKGKGKKGKENPKFSGSILGAILIFMTIHEVKSHKLQTFTHM